MTARALLLGLSALIGTLLLVREGRRGALAPIHRLELAWLRATTGQPVRDAGVVLVALDDADWHPEKRLFDSWPPGPLDFALIFENLARRQPAVVAVEPTLDWPGAGPLEFASLHERAALLPASVFGVAAQTLAGDTSRLPRLARVEGKIDAIPEIGGILAAPSAEWSGGRNLGLTRLDFSPANARTASAVPLPLVARIGQEVVPTLLLEALRLRHGVPPEAVTVHLGKEIRLGDREAIPIDPAGRFQFFVGVTEPLPQLSVRRLLLDAGQDRRLFEPGAPDLLALDKLAGSLAIVADTTQSAPRFVTDAAGPVSRWSFGEGLARALAAIESGKFVRECPRGIQFALWAVLGALGAWSLRWPRAKSGLVFACVALTLFLVAGIAFRAGQLWLPLVQPLALLGLLTTVSVLTAPASPSSPSAPDPPAPPPVAPAVPDGSEALDLPEPESMVEPPVPSGASFLPTGDIDGRPDGD